MDRAHMEELGGEKLQNMVRNMDRAQIEIIGPEIEQYMDGNVDSYEVPGTLFRIGLGGRMELRVGHAGAIGTSDGAVVYRGPVTSSARLAEHLWSALTDAIRRDLVLRRQPIHHRPLDVVAARHDRGTRPQRVTAPRRRLDRFGRHHHRASHGVPRHPRADARALVSRHRDHCRSTNLGRPAVPPTAARNHLPGASWDLRCCDGR